MMAPVCLVLGAGRGIGGSVAARFAQGGYHAVLTRRSDQSGLDELVLGIQSDGGLATGYLANLIEPEVIEDLIDKVERTVGPIRVVVFNLGAQIGHRTLAETSVKDFTRGWQMATLALFRVAKTVAPFMAARGEGVFLVTSATAAMRGNAGQHSHAAAMGGRRMLCQSLNAELSASGIHVAHIVVDGAVDAPDTLGKMLGEEGFAKLRQTKGLDKDGLMLPKEIAETYFHLAHQHRSTWTHELDLRAHSDRPWWNH
ncbi:MAG: SDR family NAD(P)-dependent oxidoreductase [Pseudomonadales bacterium]|jgi:NAD(P)-dependent dehydrogenase (short-subunit alcohol dehydrogenase family)